MFDQNCSPHGNGSNFACRATACRFDQLPPLPGRSSSGFSSTGAGSRYGRPGRGLCLRARGYALRFLATSDTTVKLLSWESWRVLLGNVLTWGCPSEPMCGIVGSSFAKKLGLADSTWSRRRQCCRDWCIMPCHLSRDLIHWVLTSCLQSYKCCRKSHPHYTRQTCWEFCSTLLFAYCRI